MDHLAWTAERLQELGSRTSLLNPLWYAGAYALGAVAASVMAFLMAPHFMGAADGQAPAMPGSTLAAPQGVPMLQTAALRSEEVNGYFLVHQSSHPSIYGTASLARPGLDAAFDAAAR